MNKYQIELFSPFRKFGEGIITDAGIIEAASFSVEGNAYIFYDRSYLKVASFPIRYAIIKKLNK